MPEELYPEEIIHLALQQVGALPYIICSGYHIVFANLFCNHLHADALVCPGVLKDVNAPQSFFPEVLTNYRDEVVEVLFLLQVCHL